MTNQTTEYPRFHVVRVNGVIGIYDGRFLKWAVADREQANRIVSDKFSTRDEAQAEADRLAQG
jgi:hypothetical protein